MRNATMPATVAWRMRAAHVAADGRGDPLAGPPIRLGLIAAVVRGVPRLATSGRATTRNMIIMTIVISAKSELTMPAPMSAERSAASPKSRIRSCGRVLQLAGDVVLRVELAQLRVLLEPPGPAPARTPAGR